MSDIVNAIDHFFNDIIAQIIPGIFLLVLLSIAFDINVGKTGFSWVVLVVAAYILGHLILSIANLLNKFFDWFKIEKIDLESFYKAKPMYKQYVKILHENEKNIGDTHILKLRSDFSFYDYRGIAMSINNDAATLGRRFMFIHLCCRGAMMSLMLSAPFVIVKIILSYNLPFYIGFSFLFLLVLVVMYPLQVRSKDFHTRAMMVPFSCATSKFISKCYD